VSFFGDENTDKSASLRAIHRSGKNSAWTLKTLIPAEVIICLDTIKTKKPVNGPAFKDCCFFIE
jgi:hypothetical protein